MTYVESRMHSMFLDCKVVLITGKVCTIMSVQELHSEKKGAAIVCSIFFING